MTIFLKILTDELFINFKEKQIITKITNLKMLSSLLDIEKRVYRKVCVGFTQIILYTLRK